ncbi:MAG: hypothetical protein K6G11_07615, partial [Lachnospiraceae bacterium]|nr:hypothetical protein [Lachnospiraceae bacterium]
TILIDNLNKQLKNSRLMVTLTSNAYDFIADAAYDPQYGARPLKRFIQKNIETTLATKIISGEFMQDDVIEVDSDGDKLLFSKN